MKSIGLSIAFVVLFACFSFADAITFTDISTGSGTIGSTPFSNAPFTITGLGDTSSRSSCGACFFIDLISASISIGGVGNFAITTPTRFFVNNSLSIVGFSRAGISGLDLLNGPTDPAFATWDMLTSIGPISGPGQILQWTASSSQIDTSGGVLVMNDARPDVTFQATVRNSVPEPSTLLLLGIGLLGVGRRVKRKIAS